MKILNFEFSNIGPLTHNGLKTGESRTRVGPSRTKSEGVGWTRSDSNRPGPTPSASVPLPPTRSDTVRLRPTPSDARLTSHP